MEPLGTIVSIITIIEKVYSGGKWISGKTRKWEPVMTGFRKDERLRLDGAEYYKLGKEDGLWRTFNFGKEKFREENRLVHDRQKLIDTYPGLGGQLLAERHIGQMPYQVLSTQLEQVHLAIQPTDFQLPAELKSIYNATYEGLKKHYNRFGIEYEALSLARIRQAVFVEAHEVTVERTNYTVAASSNLIADLNIQTAIGKALLLEDGSGSASTIREFECSLVDCAGSLTPFEHSALANPMGVAGIAVTADNKLVISRRSRNVSTYAGMFAPSASGYVSWYDVITGQNHSIDTVLRFALKREISEELHLDITNDLGALYPLGLYRELYRAGMPQAFYAFKINLTADELIERIAGSRNTPEFMGLLFIPINRQIAGRVITALARSEEIGGWPVGLELRGLLTALAAREENPFFEKGK